SDDLARRGRRVEAAFRVRYESIDQLAAALTNDLTHGTLFLRSARPLGVNALVRIHLDLPDGGGELSAIGRGTLVRDQAEAGRSGKPAGIGVELLDLGADRLAVIERLVGGELTTGTARGKAVPQRRVLDIVVADDDAGVRQPIAAALRRRGDRVREAV